MKWPSDTIHSFAEPKLSREDLPILISHHPLRTEQDAYDFAVQVKRLVDPVLHDPVSKLVRAIILCEDLLCPADARGDMKQTLALFSSTRVLKALEIIREVIVDLKLPDFSGTAIASVPLISLVKHPHFYLNNLIYKVQHAKTESVVFPNMSPQFGKNWKTAGEIDPKDSKKTPVQLVKSYLKSTPFQDFFETRAPFVIPPNGRFQHTHILAPSGTGKTHLRQERAYRDITSPDPPAVVIIEPKRDMVEAISRLKCAQGRLAIVDPTLDTPLNIFRLNSQSEDEAVSQYGYIFSAFDTDIGKNQQSAIINVARLIIRRGGNMEDFKKLLDEKPEKNDFRNSRFRKDIEKLDADGRDFFQSNFFAGSFSVSRGSLSNKVSNVLSCSKHIRNMLNADKNAVDMFDRINTPGSITLITTGQGVLTLDAQKLIGRWFISQTMNAAFRRHTIPYEHRKPAFLYLDEAHDYFSDDIERILDQCRSVKLGLIFAHQRLSQIEQHSLAKCVLGVPRTKIAHPDEADDEAMAKVLRTTSAFFRALQTQPTVFTEFGVYVRGVTNSAEKLSFPHFTVERADRIGDDEYRALRESFRYTPRPLQATPEPETARTSAKPKRAPKKQPPKVQTKKAKPVRDETVEPTDW